jgi:two-component system phosphate regulon response regulator OmpR
MAEPTHILVVDDDDRLRALLVQYLSEQGHRVSDAANTKEADEIQKLLVADALVLDVMMPGEEGTAYAVRLRQQGRRIPILMLTARGDTDERIAGLEAGAEDYLTKPFAPKELALRLTRLIERTRTAPRSQFRYFGAYVYDTETGRLTHHDGPVYLTTSEMACLKILAAQAGAAVSREVIAAAIGDVQNERSVDVQINRLRKKIEINPSKPIHIQTVRNAGYILYTNAP